MTILDSYKRFLSSVNPWWEMPDYRFDLIDRPYYLDKILHSDERLIRILIGARRVGKTTILQSAINKLLDVTDASHIIYLPADLRDLQKQGIKTTLEFCAKNAGINLFADDIYVFVDEVQELDKWQAEVKLLYDNTKINFYLTGSSSLILRKETSRLTGRFLLHYVLPLSFEEFKLFTQTLKNTISYKPGELLEEYLEIGGYPEYVLNRNKTYLKQAIESTLYRELLEHYGIRTPNLLGDLLELLADKITSPVSARRISRDLKIDDKTAKFYLDYLQAVYLIYPVYRHGRSHKISKSSVPKYYFNDTGVLNLYSIRRRIGHTVENSVFLHLLHGKLEEENPRIFYDVIDGQEIDFRVKDNLYEVKSELSKLNLEKYDLLDQKIQVIYKKNKGDFLSEHPYFPNLKLVDLQSFLS